MPYVYRKLSPNSIGMIEYGTSLFTYFSLPDLLKSICLYTPKQQRAHFLNKVVTTFNLKENGFSAFSLNKYMVLFAQKRMYVLLYMLVSLGYMVKKWMKH